MTHDQIDDFTTTDPVVGRRVSPVLLSRMLGQAHAPTPQQADVIGADPGPMLVVAGAGAGKTETMAARVVWLVAHGIATPDQILGLTFTRKAAQQLAARIRKRLATLRDSQALNQIDPTGELYRNLQSINPSIDTYDAFAGKLVGEFGLLAPVEPEARIISATELHAFTQQVVANWDKPITGDPAFDKVVATVIALYSELDNHLVGEQSITEETLAFIREVEELPRAPKQRSVNLPKELQKYLDAQQRRLDYLPLVTELRRKLAEANVTTFGMTMANAAKLASEHAVVGENLRRRYKVVMLDEYQDTSHAQRVLLRELFGGKDHRLTVTAVGDPMQSIYGWRGATAQNLERFVDDFPTLDSDNQVVGSAPKKELTTSWRNPADVLAAANDISTYVLGPLTKPKRAVSPLSPREGASAGVITLGAYPSVEQENEAIAEYLRGHYEDAVRRGEADRLSAAVLVRKNQEAAEIAQVLAAHGIPHEIMGLSGLIHLPEIADLVALARMVVDPGATTSALRILLGPLVGLSLQDLEALRRRSKQLARRARPDVVEADAAGEASDTSAIGEVLHEFQQDVAHRLIPSATIIDAIGDLGEADNYSPEGYGRLKDLGLALRRLRKKAVSTPVVDILSDIERTFRIRVEVLSRTDPRQPGAAGTTHIAKFFDEAARYSAAPGATLRGFLDYLQLADSVERGLNLGQVPPAPGRVQIMTVHKAKGLEWETVVVARASFDNYASPYWDSSRQLSTWLTAVENLPPALRGDAADGDEPEMSGAPQLRMDLVSDRKEFADMTDEHKRELKQVVKEESIRLFYVAVTRTEKNLLVTSGNPKGVCDMLADMKDAFPDSVQAWLLDEDSEANAQPVVEDSDAAHSEEEQWPAMLRQARAGVPHGSYPMDYFGARRSGMQAGFELMREARAQLPELAAGDEAAVLEDEVTALIADYEQQHATVHELTLPHALTVSDAVSIAKSRESFARRLARPVPFPPNQFAKRGTAFHQWLEDRFHGQGMLDFEDLPGMGEQEVNVRELERLKAAFLESPWADRTPAFVEEPFACVIGEHVLRGRMDAVFHDGDDPAAGWLVLDWKTGHEPTKNQLAAATVQLAVYRIAWAKIIADRFGVAVDPASVRAAFYYIGDKKLLEPAVLPDEQQLAQLLKGKPKTVDDSR